MASTSEMLVDLQIEKRSIKIEIYNFMSVGNFNFRQPLNRS